MSKTVKSWQVLLAAGIAFAPLAVATAGLADAQPSPLPTDVCFNGPYPSPPPPWGPGTIQGCVNPDSWFSGWGWRYSGKNGQGEAGQSTPAAPAWQYVGPNCTYASDPNWRYTGSDCQPGNP